LRRLAQLGTAGVGDLRVRHPRVGRARLLLDVTATLQAFEQARDPGRREQHALGEVDAAKRTVLGARQVEEHLVVADRQPVLALQLRRKLARDRRVGAQERDPGLEVRVDGGSHFLVLSRVARVWAGPNGEMRWMVGLSLSRVLAIGGLAAAAAGVLIAVSRGLQAGTTVTSGVAAAEAVQAKPVHHTVRIDGATIRVTKKPTGSVCYSAPHGVSDCASSLGAEQVSYASGHAGKRLVVAGVAGAHVKAVIV